VARRKVWLVRHGDAVDGPVDAQRPLSDAGRREVEAIARALARTGKVRPAQLLHSGRTRALQTAEIVAAGLGGGAPEATDGLHPGDDPEIWEERLARRTDDVMLVGHLPHMEALVATLVGAPDEDVVRLVTGGVVCLSRDDEDGPWSIAWMLTPGVVAAPS
jgi:phosphohistidine phosphatase